jgi:hypothetical protein
MLRHIPRPAASVQEEGRQAGTGRQPTGPSGLADGVWQAIENLASAAIQIPGDPEYVIDTVCS